MNCEPFLFKERFGVGEKSLGRGECYKKGKESKTQFPDSINLGEENEPTMPFGGPVPRRSKRRTDAS